MDDKAGSKRGSKQEKFLYSIMVAFLALFFLQWFFNNTTELSPNRGDDIESASRLLALSVGLALLTIAGLIKPVTGISRPAFIMVGGALGTVLGYLVGLVVIGTVYQAYDFSGPNTIRRQELFPIKGFYQTYGRQECYHVQLRDYDRNFCIGGTDYKAMFNGQVRELIHGLCLHVDSERNGTAIRIMHSTKVAFGAGAVIRCDDRR